MGGLRTKDGPFPIVFALTAVLLQSLLMLANHRFNHSQPLTVTWVPPAIKLFQAVLVSS